jgi:hypothetical protein
MHSLADTMKSIFVMLTVLLLSAAAGCQPRMASQLQGRWQGRPDSAVQRAQRDAVKYGDPEAAATPQQVAAVTDWQQYDVTVGLDFLSEQRLEMSLEGAQAQAGTWKIVSESPAACTIEVQTETTAASQIERRRFNLLLDERDGVVVGFQLTEEGADPQLGALYFQRASP